jgi:hypothetical protein
MRTIITAYPILLAAMTVGCWALTQACAYAQDPLPPGGLKVIVKVGQTEARTLNLTNVWMGGTNGMSEEVFWNRQGLTNAPIELRMGGYHYQLLVAQDHVLPFIRRQGALNKPDAIWRLPTATVHIYGQEELQITSCRSIGILDGKLALSDTTTGRAVFWKLWAERNGNLHIEVTAEPNW